MTKERTQLLKSIYDHHRKNVWAIDYDYLHKLSDNELKYLWSFTQYWHKGNPHKATKKFKCGHRMRTDSYRRNNRAIIDVLNQVFIDESYDMRNVPDSFNEDFLVEILDNNAIVQTTLQTHVDSNINISEKTNVKETSKETCNQEAST